MSKTENQKKRKALMLTSVFTNLGLLGIFKYFNFFIDSFASTFTLLGQEISVDRLEIVLPVGISFYTFQTLSYSIDLYNRKMEAYKDPVGFFAFVSFFPQLVAGPIERAKDLLPQFNDLKVFNYDEVRRGLIQMAWGFLKKVVIADRLAIFINSTYGDPAAAEGLPMIMGVIFFAFQLYLDFSAYSDIAIGCARTLGFKLSLNFNRPYLASSFSNFWTRWHITLSTWFRDYLYIPLGGNRNNKTTRNILIVFMVSGLWHGASWNFVIWGAINGLFLIVLDPILAKLGKNILSKVIIVVIVFTSWSMSLIFFRAQTFDNAIAVFKNLGFNNAGSLYEHGLVKAEYSFAIYAIIILLIIELIQQTNLNVFERFFNLPLPFRWLTYTCWILVILFLGSYGLNVDDASFIYFQF
ncbi:MAG: MBOAT family protein [Salibacteraceae bacterium]|nr:MBOAT family protein [Salibacteraceae bacterium]